MLEYDRAPKDNFFIKPQLYVIQILTVIDIFILALVNLYPGAPIFLCVSNVIITFVIAVDILVPIYLVFFRFKYEVEKAVSVRRALLVQTTLKSNVSETDSARIPDDSYLRVATDKKKKKHLSINSQSKSSQGLSVQTILDSPKLKEAFTKYLAREFSLESLAFIEVVLRYRQQFSQPQTRENILALCDRIINDYMTPTSVNEVNLPVHVKKKVINIVDSIRQSGPLDEAKYIFDEPVNHISEMLSVNHLRKFLLSSLFPKDL